MLGRAGGWVEVGSEVLGRSGDVEHAFVGYCAL